MKIEQVDESATHELYVVGGEQDWRRTGCSRFDFVRGCVSQTKGFVINLGCADDPAGLKKDFGPRVCNVDYISANGYYPDVWMDVTKAWDAFADNSAEMVVMGDLLHVLPPDRVDHVLKEARRVAQKLCLTVPTDYGGTVTCFSEENLRFVLKETGWYSYLFAEVGWGFAAWWKPTEEVTGFCVEAGRA